MSWFGPGVGGIHSGAGSAGVARAPGDKGDQGTSPAKWCLPAPKRVEGRAETLGHTERSKQLLLQALLQMRQLLVPGRTEAEGWRAKSPATDPLHRGVAAELPNCMYSAPTPAKAELGEHQELLKKSCLSTPK